MDHNLDSLNLESSMGVDFESPDNIEVSQADLELPSTSHDESIPMDFQQIEEQPIMMDTGSEEIIDFMGDQFSLQEYSVQDNETTGLTTTAESNQNVLTSQAETLMDLQLNPQSAFVTENPTVISVKAEVPARGTTTKKLERPQIAPLPRQVAIAPKPPPLAAKTFAGTIGPKPVALVKKVALSNVMQASSKGNTVLAQVGKQLVMMPAGTQKLKLVSAGSGTSAVQYVRASGDQASLLQTKDQKPVMMAKVIMPGVLVSQSSSNQSAVLAKILPSTSAKSTQPRFVTMQPKAVPITIGNKVIMSPTKQGGKMGKTKQIISIQSPSPKLLPASSGTTTKKVVISSNPAQSVILKPAAAPKTAQISSDGNVVIDGQHTQLHQINVPGKGIQYIRLVTNPNTAKTKGSGSLLSVPSKFVLTDSKEGGKTLVRIAPVVPKASVSQPARSSQSLLAPLSPVPDTKNLNLSELLETSSKEMEASAENSREETEEIDSKAALQSLINSTVHEDDMHLSLTEVEIEYKKPPSPKQRHKSIDMMESSPRDEDARLIMIPSSYDMSNSDMIVPDEVSSHDESHRSLLNMESEPLNTYTSPLTPQAPSESEVAAELGLRPRKACNCTKSQCLKLYCDCFANGEFCNRCNCNNCHNNLENEELRQKAIRGCLERNPNAFRPKIGKTKAGGPEIIRRHNKGCNCKRSGCLKNYCECFEAKIACTAMCRCVGCRNVEETLEHFRRAELPARRPLPPHLARRAASNAGPHAKQPCTFMTSEVIEAVCQCLLAAAGEGQAGAGGAGGAGGEREPLRDVIDEFARCLQDIIGAAHHAPTATTTQPLLNQGAT